MTPEQIREMIATLTDEEQALAARIQDADLKLGQVRAALSHLVALEAGKPLMFHGPLAEACRVALRKSPEFLSPIQVREELKAIGYDLSRHSHPMASIHSVLKRFAQSGTAIVSAGASGVRYGARRTR